MRRPEQTIHRAVVKHLRWRGVPGLVFIHPPNGGARSGTEASILAGLGVRAGASDLLLWHAGRSYALELKGPKGRLTDQQRSFLQDMERAGAQVGWAVGLDGALEHLERWGLLRGSVV